MARKARRQREADAPLAVSRESKAADHARFPPWTFALGIAVLTIIVFTQVVTHEFIEYDDGVFVYQNEHVRQGLTSSSIRWALTASELGYYPLTWLSHMSDVSLFGLHAGRHLVSSLLLHIASSVILFFALFRMTAARVRSAFVAALFAIHPMHVESVAWVAERKDTLSVFFGVLALLFYSLPRTRKRDILVAIALIASLLAKQMLVTFPFVLLLLDYWPLRRTEQRRATLIIEKIPLFLIVAIGIALAIAGQRNMNAVQSTAVIPIGTRVANALIAYAVYIIKLLWPSRLAPMYPLTAPATGDAVASFLLLTVITALAVSLRKRAPYFITGWLWFLGTLVPVIGVVQIGAASMADRYTYFPAIGFFIALVWGIGDLLPARVATVAGGGALAILSIVAFIQTSYWKNTETLFTHTIAVTGPNPIAEYTLGGALQVKDPDEAIAHLRRSIELTEAALRASPGAPLPDIYPQSHVGIGTALLTKANAATDGAAKAKLITESAAAYEAALRLDPKADNARRNLALVQRMIAQSQDSTEAQIDSFVDAGVRFAQQQKFADAVAEYRKAVAIAPRSVEARVYLAIGLAQAKQNAAAARELREAQAIDASRTNMYVSGILRLDPASDNVSTLLRQLEQ